jgi:hypothetical protein
MGVSSPKLALPQTAASYPVPDCRDYGEFVWTRASPDTAVFRSVQRTRQQTHIDKRPADLRGVLERAKVIDLRGDFSLVQGLTIRQLGPNGPKTKPLDFVAAGPTDKSSPLIEPRERSFDGTPVERLGFRGSALDLQVLKIAKTRRSCDDVQQALVTDRDLQSATKGSRKLSDIGNCQCNGPTRHGCSPAVIASPQVEVQMAALVRGCGARPMKYTLAGSAPERVAAPW